jgi:hypothetical protein
MLDAVVWLRRPVNTGKNVDILRYSPYAEWERFRALAEARPVGKMFTKSGTRAPFHEGSSKRGKR